ncbi:unnamed protein product, partial [Rotaria magnacalcarata]
MSSRGRAVSLTLSHTDCLSITIVQPTKLVTTNSTQHTQLSTEPQGQKRQEVTHIFLANKTEPSILSIEETFIQPSLSDRLPNDFIPSPDIRQIDYLDDNKPFINSIQQSRDYHVDNQSDFQSTDSNK